jgi:hypothetical protein
MKDAMASAIRKEERGRKLILVASTAFECTRGQDPNSQTWNLLGTCCKSEHNYRQGCCERGIGCQNRMMYGSTGSMLQDKDERHAKDFGSDTEIESELQYISCAICGNQGTAAVCSECALRVCEDCLNSSGKCMECQNPWQSHVEREG